MANSTVELSREELLARSESLAAENQQLNKQVEWLTEQLRLQRHKQFGPSSEAISPEQAQFVFNEAEVEVAPEAPEPDVETITYSRRKPGQRAEQTKDLPVEEVRYELDESERACPQCANLLHAMSEEVREEVKIIPAQAKLVKHIRVTYACRYCANHDTTTPVLTAPMPKPAFPGSLASPSAVAYVMSQKFELGLPLYRQEQHFGELGIELSRQTLANWMIKGAGLLNPLYERLHQLLLLQDILHADETTVQVLHEAGRAPQTQSFMWVYRTGSVSPPIVLYDYQTTRGAPHPRKFLDEYKGYLHVDGYGAYDGLPNVTLVGCWSHARRKFDEALKALPQLSRSGAKCPSREGLHFCNRLFKIESDLREATPEGRYAARQERSVPVLREFKTWLDQQQANALPKSPLGKAVGYCHNQWPKLNTFLLDGRLELDNNRCERSIKPFVIGRKNWLFCNTPKGATASSIIYSMIETAKENGLNAREYLIYLFERLPNIQTTDAAALDQLLPWSETVHAVCSG